MDSKDKKAWTEVVVLALGITINKDQARKLGKVIDGIVKDAMGQNETYDYPDDTHIVGCTACGKSTLAAIEVQCEICDECFQAAKKGRG